jgi:hypothetical protein
MGQTDAAWPDLMRTLAMWHPAIHLFRQTATTEFLLYVEHRDLLGQWSENSSGRELKKVLTHFESP